MEGEQSKQSSTSSPDELGAWWYSVVTWLPEGKNRRALFRCSSKHAEAVLTHPGLVGKNLRLGPRLAHLHASAVALANMWGKGVKLAAYEVTEEHLRTVLAQAAAKCVQQQPGGSPVGSTHLKAFTSVQLSRVEGLISLVPDFIMEHCPCLTQLCVVNCNIQSLPAVGASLKSWPQLQALTVWYVRNASATTAQVTQQLHHLPGLQSLCLGGVDTSKWAGVPSVLGPQLTALRVEILDHRLVPEGCAYPQLEHLRADSTHPEQCVSLHKQAPALTHLQLTRLTTDQLARLPISWVSQLKQFRCTNLSVGGEQPDAAVLAVLKALGKLQLGSQLYGDGDVELHCLSSCSSDLWAAVMPHLQSLKECSLRVYADRPLTRSDVSVMGQHLLCCYVQLMGGVKFEPVGVFSSLLQLLPHVHTLEFQDDSYKIQGLTALACRADRSVTIIVYEEDLEALDENYEATLADIQSLCGHDYVTFERY